MSNDTDTDTDVMAIAGALPVRHRTRQARVAWGDHVVTVGGDAPVTT